ncbi:anthocyanidin 3-O-glucosyltransferase 2-like [Prosopis cineraria]|uniref:anthocyanidin 3-O-glucosyltransferase 2-like n=1 Tax=Prosopis cineraria TaxID=364024 RepID=UPI00240FD5E5|nr:anthocyanidin 3-O-glucosyltransferase 2-like [Prosopis cineraria]
MKKSQLVFVPCPGMGHLVATVEFVKILINRHDRLSITVLIIRPTADPTVDAYTRSLTSSISFPKRLHFIFLPPHPDPANSHSLHPSAFMDSLIENQKPNVRAAVTNLNSGPDSPGLAGFVLDMFCTSMIDVANEFGVPAMVFFTSGSAFLGFKLHMHTLQERENEDATAFNLENSDTEFTIPSFENQVPVGVFPGITLDKQWKLFFFNHASRMKKAKGIIVNTFEELESHAVQSFSNSDLTVYPVGPILSVGENKTVTQGSHVMQWLDDQPPSSVLFLCFGSRGYFQENQVREIARALERSGVHFLWSLRKPPPKGSMKAPGDYSNPEEVLPEGFIARTAEIGRVTGWAPQAQILAHKAVGGFVSHCGWNSILESIYYGVPIATWPLAAEQQMNAFLLVRELKLGVEISLDYRIELGRVIGVEKIEKGMKEVMEKDGEVRKKVKEMSELSRKALMEGGSSFSYLGRFIHDLLS